MAVTYRITGVTVLDLKSGTVYQVEGGACTAEGGETNGSASAIFAKCFPDQLNNGGFQGPAVTAKTGRREPQYTISGWDSQRPHPNHVDFTPLRCVDNGGDNWAYGYSHICTFKS